MKEQDLVNKLQGFKLLKRTGDIFDPTAFSRDEFKDPEAFRFARDFNGGVVINIENVVGLDPEEISKALSDELSGKTTL